MCVYVYIFIHYSQGTNEYNDLRIKFLSCINIYMYVALYCMSYALMLFKELFASQLSVPSSPEHPTKCTTV